MHILSSNLCNLSKMVCENTDKTSAFMQMIGDFMQYLFILNMAAADIAFFWCCFFLRMDLK